MGLFARGLCISEGNGLKMNLGIRKTFAVFLSALILMLCMTAVFAAPVSAATKVGLSKSSITLEVGQTTTLKLNGTSGGKVTWSMSNKKVAKYSKGGKVTGVSEGTAYIYAKYKGKKYKCTVNVVSSGSSTSDSCDLRVKKGGSVNAYIYTDVKALMVGTSDSSVCDFSGKALSDGSGYRITVKGKKNGTAKIMFYDNFDPSVYMEITVKVGSVSDGDVSFSFGKGGSKPAGSNNGTGGDSQDTGSAEDAVDEVIRLINEERAAAGKPALKKNSELCENAQLRAKEIGEYFSHTRPDGTSCFTAITVPYGYAGENIAMGQRNAAEVMDCWMNSSGHRQNILSSNYTSVGVGYDPSTNCWVQIFISD